MSARRFQTDLNAALASGHINRGPSFNSVGKQYSCDCVKLHLMVGTKTNVIVGVSITDRDRHDGTQRPALVEGAAQHFNVRRSSPIRRTRS